MREAPLHIRKLIKELVMLLPVHYRAWKAGFGKEALFMVKVKAG